MARDFRSVGVVGLGTMGAGIVEVFARSGIDVVAVDVVAAGVEHGKRVLGGSTGRALARGRITQDEHDALHSRVTYTTEVGDLAECLLVVEAVPEDLALKKDILARVDAVVSAHAVLATNTSSLSVTEIAVATRDPGRVVGMHFFNPAPVQRLVEVVRTVVTADDVVEDVTTLARRIGKAPVVVGDRAGFVANALLFGYLNRAVAMVESRYATREDLDAAMRLGCGYPMGPLQLLDLIGLDTACAILETMYEQGRDRLHAPAPLLTQMVSAGLLGRKSGRGFYTYAEPWSREVVADDRTPVGGPPAGSALRPVTSVGVVGSGALAAGIVEVLAGAGLAVTSVAGGGDELESLADVDLVVEALAEDLGVTQDLFRDLDRICAPGAILATATSTLAVIDCATVTSRPQDVVGLHVVDPARVVRLVEVVHTVSTAPDVVATVQDLCGRVGTVAVTCGDRSGFLVDALLFPYLNDAVKMLAASYSTVDDIDAAMTHGCGLPTGPFELLDVVGLDVALAVQRRLYRESREPGLAPSPLLEHLVAAGHLGLETGRGFRTHP